MSTDRRSSRDGLIQSRADGTGLARARGSTWVRLVGAAGMVALTLALWWLLTHEGFRVDAASVSVSGVRYVAPARVEEIMADLARGPNVFRLRPGDLERSLLALPEVRVARASVALPASVRVLVVEREAVFVWSNGGEAWLVDREGVLFARPGPGDLPPTPFSEPDADAAAADAPDADTPDADAPDAGASDAPGDGTADASVAAPDAAPGSLPVVEDGRIVAEPPGQGDRLGELDLTVLRHLLALTPEVIGSSSSSLRLRVDELDGYVLESLDRGWQAVFGRYSPTLHPPTLIPRQVQCLAALLSEREARLSRVWLVPAGVNCGTLRRFEPAA